MSTPNPESSVAPNPERDLVRGSAGLLVLSVLADGPRWGYAIQKRIEQTTGHSLGAGSLYPLLHRLESQGFIAAEWDQAQARPRKHYRLTSEGRLRLQRDAAQWQAALGRLQALVLPALRRVTNHPVD